MNPAEVSPLQTIVVWILGIVAIIAAIRYMFAEEDRPQAVGGRPECCRRWIEQLANMCSSAKCFNSDPALYRQPCCADCDILSYCRYPYDFPEPIDAEFEVGGEEPGYAVGA